MSGRIRYDFLAEIWKYTSTGSWYFVSLPESISAEIREHLGWQEEGWGRMKASAQIDAVPWDTAIWFDKKRNTYLLPLKAEIRKKASLDTGQQVQVTLRI